MIDWHASNIQGSYQFEMIDPTDLTTSRGFIDGVIPDQSSIKWGYYTELKMAGTLAVSDCDYKDGNLIRVWYIAESMHAATNQESSGERVCLGTYFVGTSNSEYRYGRYTGTLNLHSTLIRFSKDKCETNTVLAKGKKAKSWFWSCVAWAGGIGRIIGELPDKTFTANKTINFGQSKLEVLNYIAGYLDAQASVDVDGRITLKRYVALSKKPISYRIPKGNSSPVFLGIVYNDGKGDVVNRCVVKYEKDKTIIYGLADRSSSHAYSYAKVRRRITNSYTVSSLSAKTTAAANAKAMEYLDANPKPAPTWRFESFYLPYFLGEVINLQYQDSPLSGGINVDGMVTEIDFRLTPGLRMTTTIKEVKRYAA